MDVIAGQRYLCPCNGGQNLGRPTVLPQQCSCQAANKNTGQVFRGRSAWGDQGSPVAERPGRLDGSGVGRIYADAAPHSHVVSRPPQSPTHTPTHTPTTHPPTHTPTHTHTHTHTHTIARQTGTTQDPNVRILVSWIVKQDRACPTPIGHPHPHPHPHTHTHQHTHSHTTLCDTVAARGYHTWGTVGESLDVR